MKEHSKDDRAGASDLTTFSRPTELPNSRLLCSLIPCGLGSLLGSECWVKMSFDNTKTIQIKLKITLKEAFVIKGSLAEYFNLAKIVLQCKRPSSTICVGQLKLELFYFPN